MAIFIDAFYPGNSKRSNRLAELTSDCQNLFADASVHKEQVEAKLETCNEVIKKAYEGLAKEPPVLKSIDTGLKWPAYVSEVLLDIFLGTGTIAALRWAVANYFVKVGTLTAEKLTELGVNNALKVVLPKWMKIGGEAGVMVIVTVITDMIVDAIDGAVERSKLRKAIKEAADTRVESKIVDLHNRNLTQTLDAVIMSCEVFTEMKELPEETLNQIIQSIVNKHKVTENDISRKTAVDYLIDFDTSRKSWTDEDGDWRGVQSVRMLKASSHTPDRAEQAIMDVESIPQETKQQFLRAINQKYGN